MRSAAYEKADGFGLCLSIVANAGLAYLWWDLRKDFDSSQSRLDAQVAAAEQRVTAITERAIDEVPDVGRVQEEVDHLETALFGPFGTRLRRDVIGSLERDVGSLQSMSGEVDALKMCVNDAFGRLRNYSEQVAGYAALVASGSVAVKPFMLTPRCY